MKFLIHIMRAYPARTLITLTALLIAGIVAGISLTALLPVLSLATDPEAAGEDNLLVRGLTAIGLSPTLGILLSVLVIGMALKSLITLYANRHVGYTVAQIATDLRLNLLRALLEARWDYYVHQPVGALGNSMATEAARAANAYLDGSRTVALLIETLVYVAVAMMVVKDPDGRVSDRLRSTSRSPNASDTLFITISRWKLGLRPPLHASLACSARSIVAVIAQ